MLQRITYKLVTLSVLIGILATVSIAPASSTNRQVICFDVPMTAECPSGYMCCSSPGECTCG